MSYALPEQPKRRIFSLIRLSWLPWPALKFYAGQFRQDFPPEPFSGTGKSLTELRINIDFTDTDFNGFLMLSAGTPEAPCSTSAAPVFSLIAFKRAKSSTGSPL